MKHTLALLITACLSLCAGALAAGPPKPNIVFVLYDDMGYGEPKCYRADSKLNTPNKTALDNPLPVPSQSRRVATNLNLNRRGAPGSGLPGLDVQQENMIWKSI
jgi:hypothetical protein